MPVYWETGTETVLYTILRTGLYGEIIWGVDYVYYNTSYGYQHLE